MSNKKPFYGKNSKEKVVFEYQNSSASAAELARLHGILGSNTVADWVRKYGNLHRTKPADMPKHHSPIHALEKKDRERRQRSYEQLRISELEAELDEAKLRIRFYACAIAVASQATGIDLLKKIGGQLSRP